MRKASEAKIIVEENLLNAVLGNQLVEVYKKYHFDLVNGHSIYKYIPFGV